MGISRSTFKVPKLVHFIWAGGDKIMPEDALANVVSWAQQNPDFTMKIWVDRATDPYCDAKYKNLFDQLFGGKPANIQLVDITGGGVCTPEIRYELNNLCPNYGASSDMLRYEIEKKEGGLHIDCKDVFPNPKFPLNTVRFADGTKFAGQKVFDTELPEPVLMLHVTPHSFVGHGKEAPGTEAMLCTPDHPKMKLLAETARESYHKPAWGYKIIKFIYDHFSSAESRITKLKNDNVNKGGAKEFGRHTNLLRIKKSEQEMVRESTLYQEEIEKRRAMNTLDLTGPGMAVRVLQLDASDKASEFLMPHNKERTVDWVTLPKEHAGSWTKLRFIPHKYDEAIESAVASIQFEADNMKIFNLNGHVEAVLGSLLAAGEVPKHQKVLDDFRVKIKKDLTMLLENDLRFRILPQGELGLRPQEKASGSIKIRS